MIAYLTLLVGPLIVLSVIMYASVQQNYDEIKKDWVQYRCSPLYMPFVSMFTEETTTSENFKFCMNAFASEIFARATEPVYQIFEVFIEALNKFTEDIQSFLTFLAGMDKFIFSFAESIFSKIHNTIGVFLHQIGSLRDVLNRIMGSAYYAAFIAQTMVEFGMAVFNLTMTIVKAVVIMIFIIALILVFFYPIVLAFFIPIGGLIGISYCFDPDTIVSTQRGNIPLKEIQLGDNIEKSRVTGIFFMESKDVELFDYKGTIVSGRHIVYSDGWKYVKDTDAKVYTGKRPEYLICLNTDDNVIQIGDTLFRDYEETSEPESIAEIERIVWGMRVNAKYSVGLDPTSFVRDISGNRIELGHVKIGDQLQCGRVSAVICLDGSEMVWYDIDGVAMSGCQPVVYYTVGLAKDTGKRLSYKKPVAIQIIVENATGWFKVNDKLLVRDYPDSHDERVLEKIQTVVLKSLLSKK